MARPRKVQPEDPREGVMMIECLWASIGTNRGKLFCGEVGEIGPDEDEIEIMRIRAAEGAVRFL